METKDILYEVSEILSTARLDLKDRAKLVENLKFIYHVIRASSDLLEFAHSKTHGKLGEYYKDHICEEAGHADWLHADLRESDVNVEACPSSAAQLAGSVFYHLQYTHNVSLLGYMLVLEGMAPSLDLIIELENIHGAVLLRTARYHAENDPDHGKKLFLMIDGLSDFEKQIVRKIAIETAAQLANQFIAIQGVQ